MTFTALILSRWAARGAVLSPHSGSSHTVNSVIKLLDQMAAGYPAEIGEYLLEKVKQGLHVWFQTTLRLASGCV